MISVAETKPADLVIQQPIESHVEVSGLSRAISYRASFDDLAAVMDMAIAVRRPARCRPAAELEAELAAWDAASDEAWESIDDSAK
jgi:hypothetical protein